MGTTVITPIISVVMSVFNGELFLKTAIESILDQNFTNFELIIVDDGSTDSSATIIRNFEDERIIFIQNGSNKGLVFSLNTAIRISKGKYIARFDADDISLSNRLEEQFNFLEKNPSVSLLGSNVQFIINGKLANKMKLPSSNKAAKCRLLFNTTFVHPSVMLRSCILKKYNYSPDLYPAEDYFLWTKIAQNHSIANLNKVLVYCRIHDNNIHLNTKEIVLKKIEIIYKDIFYHTFNHLLTTENIEVHQCLCLYKRDFTPKKNKSIMKWIKELEELNRKSKAFHKKVFNRQLSMIWINYTYNYVRHGKYNINIFKSKLVFYAPITMIIKTLSYILLNVLKTNRNA